MIVMLATKLTAAATSATYLVLACKSGEVHRFERIGPGPALTTRRRLAAIGYAVTVLAPGAWAHRRAA